MEWSIVKKIGDYIQAYTNNQVFGYIRLVIDILLIIAAIVVIYRVLKRYTNHNVILFLAAGLIGLLAVILLLDLQVLFALYPYIVCVTIGIWLFYNASKLKTLFGDIIKTKSAKNFVLDKNAQQKLIEVIVRTVEHLSTRKIGAIISIEKQDSLNTLIDRGTKLDAEISFELLSTIFMPGTALHDGGVIIRGNRVMSAASFYPSTDKTDVPKNFGSRHRAAIGISEVTDAFTIVVSEETGHITLTQEGTIIQNASLDSLSSYLEQNIIIE